MKRWEISSGNTAVSWFVPNLVNDLCRSESHIRKPGEFLWLFLATHVIPMLFLTLEELSTLTGRRMPAAQIRWLKKHHWIYDIGADGLPKVA